MKGFLRNLKNPKTLLTVATQIVAMLILVGVQMDEEIVLTAIGMMVGLLSTLGVIHKTEASDLGICVKRMTCSRSGRQTIHLLIGGQMVCKECGAVYAVTGEDEDANGPVD